MTDESFHRGVTLNPYARLWLSMALGAAGTVLLPAESSFFGPCPFVSVGNATFFLWLFAAEAAVLMLHRIERHRTPRKLYFFLGIALALCLIIPDGTGWGQHHEGRAFIGFYMVVFLVFFLGAGALLVQPRIGPQEASRPLCKSLVRGLAIVLTAPLLLFSCRPVKDKQPLSIPRQLSKTALGLFLHILAEGFALPFTLSGLRWYSLSDLLEIRCVSFTVWTYLGCSLLFLLSPWPEQPRLAKAQGPLSGHNMILRAATAFLVVTVFLALFLNGLVYLLMFLYPHLIWGGIGCILALILIPGPHNSVVPRLDELPEAQKARPASTLLFLALALFPLGTVACHSFLSIVTGQLFTSPFDSDVAGGSLDQTTFTKHFFFCLYSSAILIPYMGVARWIGVRETRWAYWALALPVGILCLLLLASLTVPYYWLIQTVVYMGWTPARLVGLVYGAMGFVVLSTFLYWMLRPGGGTESGNSRNIIIKDTGGYPQ